jgi:hypothetical protein
VKRRAGRPPRSVRPRGTACCSGRASISPL